MRNFVHDMLHGSPAALRIEALWNVSLAPLNLDEFKGHVIRRNMKREKRTKQSSSKVRLCYS
jgi:hypothetical protein